MGSRTEDKIRCFGGWYKEREIILWEKYWSASDRKSSTELIGRSGSQIRVFRAATSGDLRLLWW